MKKLLLLMAATGSAVLLPVLALMLVVGIATTSVAGSSFAGDPSTVGGDLAPDARIPPAARQWVAITHSVCPDLPQSWIAAVMAQESDFRPAAYADDSNGGTWGLLQMNASIWAGAYGAPWSADLNHNGIWDIKEPLIHAAVGGKYLCARLAGVRRIRTAHPDWPSSTLPELDALIIAHNAGESRLRSYPRIPAVTQGFLRNVHARVARWTG